MLKSALKPIGLLLAVQLLLVPVIYAQCLPDTALVVKVNQIHADAAMDNLRKIQLLKTLQQQFLKCGAMKNAAYALLLHRLGDICHKAGHPLQAVSYTKEAIVVNASGKPGTDLAFLANSYFNLGIFYKRLHLPKASHHYFDRCIATGSKYPEKYFIVFMAFEQKAYAYYQTGDYQQGMRTADEGLRFAAEVRDPSPRAALLAQRAQSAGELALFITAETDINQAITLLETAGNDPVHLATCYSVYAALLCKTHNPKTAISYYRKAFELNKSNGNIEQCARDIQDIGCVYADELKQGDEALKCYRSGAELAKTTGDPYQLSALYANMGVVYKDAKNYSKALRYYQQALNTLPLNFTDTALKANPGQQSLKLVANDYFMFSILSNKGAALLDRYGQNRNRDDLKLALNTFELADQTLDMMRWKQTGIQSKLVWRQKTREMYARCIEVCYQLKAIDKAYYFFEKSRAVLLNDQLSEAGAEEMLKPEDRKLEMQLRIKASVLSEQLCNAPVKGVAYARQKQDWLHAEENREQFVRTLEHKYPAYYQYKYDRAVYPYHELRHMLKKEGTSFVSYFSAGKVVYALLLSADQQQRLLKVRYPMYERDTKMMLELCSGPARLNEQFNAYKKLAYGLYLNLFSHLNVPKGRVIVSQDGHYIPFEALLSDTATQTAYLARQYVFSYVQTLRILMKNKAQKNVSSDFLGIAPLSSASKPALPALRGSDAALKQLAGNFGQASLLIGKAASKPAFLQNVANYGFVQIYAHADARSYNDATGELKEPVLYLADATVSMPDIQKLRFNKTQLLVLSACNTGIGNQVNGEGVFSMARGFMAAGVPASMTNLWQVDDQVTYRLTAAFYTYLRQGLTKDVALNHAKLDIIDEESQLYGLPCYWAATILIGDTASLVPPSAPDVYLWTAISFLILLFSLFLWFKVKK